MAVTLSSYQAKIIIGSRGKESVSTSSDLGMSKEVVTLDEHGAQFEDGTSASWKVLSGLVKKPRKCIVKLRDEWKDIRAHSETTGWVRSLCPTSGAPTTLVSGFPMHRIKDKDPWDDTKAKVSALGKVRGRVLDTATGLGYTAIQAAELADEVVTVELDPTAIEIAQMNPWSAKLFNNDKITQIIGDIAEVITDFPSGHFSAIIHDPPTIQFAGDLYSREFYTELKRVLRDKGQLFHYIADPDSKQGKKLTDGVIRRLHEAGFKSVKRHPDAFGVVAVLR